MKKATFSVIACILLSPMGFSQKNIRFGFDVGFCLNRSMYKPDTDLDRRIFGGFDGGLLAEFDVTSRFMIQPEFNYTITGVELNDGAHEHTMKLQYLNIPLLAKFSVSKRFNLLAGPQHCILLSAWNDPSGTVSTRMKEYFKFDDFILVAGAEYKFGDNLFLAVRYNQGMEQVAEEGVGFEMKNRYLGFRLGYVFGAK